MSLSPLRSAEKETCLSVAAGRLALVLVLGVFLSFPWRAWSCEGTPLSTKCPVTVADAIRMTRVVGTPYPYYSPRTGFAVFSPNGKYFAIVTSKGDIKRNANDYSLFVFRTNHLAIAAMPKPLTTFASTSNRAGIFSVTWQDNDTLLFLGSKGNRPTQLYSIQYGNGKLTRLTHRRSSLVSYGLSANGHTLVYALQSVERPLIDNRTLRYGFDVGTEWVSDIVRGLISNPVPELFLASGTRKGTALQTRNPFDSGINSLFVSPNGRYLVVKTDTMDVPGIWREYQDPGIRSVFRHPLFKGQPSRILRYELIDLRTRKSSVLLNSPTTYASSDVLWAPDSKSLLLCGIWLPLDVRDPVEMEKRRTKKFVVQITLRDRKVTIVNDRDLEPLSWDGRTGIVRFRVRPSLQRARMQAEIVDYRETAGVWKQVSVPSSSSKNASPEIYLDEGLNVPPRVIVVDPRTKSETVMPDLNPQLRRLALAYEQVIHWSTASGRLMSGGLYYPPTYRPGKRYPLVIQTHAFDPHSFWMDGPYSTAFAAQPLASAGIVVLQMNDISFDVIETPEELRHALGDYLSAIRYLDAHGIIDPRRVGIIGFSRTCMYVEYALTHASAHFAAAVIADGVDAGYLQYLLSYNANPAVASDFEAVVGAPPFGRGLQLWMKESPGFLMDKVQAPVLIQSIGPASVLDEWQWFAGLRRLGKPVDMLYLPTGVHVLVKPWDELASAQTTVDWFLFWLKGQVDADPAKAGQYRRWRELRLEQTTANRQSLQSGG